MEEKTVYVTTDGTRFDTEEEAGDHERYLKILAQLRAKTDAEGWTQRERTIFIRSVLLWEGGMGWYERFDPTTFYQGG